MRTELSDCTLDISEFLVQLNEFVSGSSDLVFTGFELLLDMLRSSCSILSRLGVLQTKTELFKDGFRALNLSSELEVVSVLGVKDRRVLLRILDR